MNRVIVVVLMFFYGFRLIMARHEGAKTNINATLGIINNFNLDSTLGINNIDSKLLMRFFQTNASWFEAVHYCNKLGARLLHPTNETFYNVSKSFKFAMNKTENKYWVDINDFGNAGDYVSFSTGEKANFLDWCEGEPNLQNVNRSNKCVFVDNTSEKSCMKKCDCWNLYSYICQFKTPRTLTVSVW